MKTNRRKGNKNGDTKEGKEEKAQRNTCIDKGHRTLSGTSDAGCHTAGDSRRAYDLPDAADSEPLACGCGDCRDASVPHLRQKAWWDNNSSNPRPGYNAVWELDLSDRSNPAGDTGHDGQFLFRLTLLSGVGKTHFVAKEFAVTGEVAWLLHGLMDHAKELLRSQGVRSFTIVPTSTVIRTFSD